ncbi:hypothetical protein CKM354_000403600 [Cercospora kikuchii]|uniref:Cytochrome P450 n=1 Tax=Cercospora kikuchii TaxID=84275 RepID=A0A9P3CLM5_9PEZI|nr:uncharacterized protein CKM354_000403600 [Cercospora kikuchii]GIZ40708.1 hypothetical protein CKM354_000403600 [Cercospora kikuchii]
MANSILNALLLGFTFVILVIVISNKPWRIGRRPTDIPPGPPTIPILGNLHQMPVVNPHLQLQKWAQEYGPVYSLMLGTTTMIVLSSDEAVKDLLDRRSGNYSDRPNMFIGQTIASGGLRLVVMRYGKFWRMIHKTIHNILNIKAAVTYVPYQDLENKIMLQGLLDQPEDFLAHIRRYTFSLSIQIIFGYRAPDTQDPNLLQLFWSFERWGKLAGSASAQLADLFPIIQSLPRAISPNIGYAEMLHKKEKDLYVRLWLRAKNALESGKGTAAYISGSLLEAGSDTTAAILYGFILACIIWPDVQKKVQAEIDRVVGSERLPTIEDYDRLHYVRACIKESLRWMPTVVLGVPHAAIQEDNYRGFRIPAGATIINNVWAIHMDPKRSPSPRTFNPDRFANDPRSLYESAMGEASKRDNYVFGAGRRLCQGIHIAERSLFLGISRLAWAFEFLPTIDAATGKPIKYDGDDLVGGITVEPRHYTCKIVPREKQKSHIIREAVQKDAEAFLDPQTGQWRNIPEGMAFSTWVPEEVEA